MPKRRYRRRRLSRRRYRRRVPRKLTSYDGIIYRKCFATYPISGDAAYTGNRMLVYWNYYDPGALAPFHTIRDSAEFITLVD